MFVQNLASFSPMQTFILLVIQLTACIKRDLDESKWISFQWTVLWLIFRHSKIYVAEIACYQNKRIIINKSTFISMASNIAYMRCSDEFLIRLFRN